MEIPKDEFMYEKTNILNHIFENRENEICNIDDEQEIVEQEHKDYKKIYSAINNLPDNLFPETVVQIKKSIDNYLKTLSATQKIKNKNFYKAGFSYAMKLIAECLYNKD